MMQKFAKYKPLFSWLALPMIALAYFLFEPSGGIVILALLVVFQCGRMSVSSRKGDQ